VYLAASGGSSSLPSILLLVVVFGAFYFLLLRPMKRRQQQSTKDAQRMRTELTEGTEIVTIGGLHGTVVDLDEDSVLLEISDGVTARYDRAAIARVVTPAEETEEDESAEDSDDDSTESTDSNDLDETANSIVEHKD
jgi:preprotein translocase subunit YajC